MIKIYHNNHCSKSREGVRIIENSNKDFQIVKYLETPPSFEELNQIINLLGITPMDLIRKNETLWKDNYKGGNYSDKELIEIMISNPKLIERPIVINGDKAIIGRPPEMILNIL